MFDKQINVLSKMIVFTEFIAIKKNINFFIQKNNMKWLKIRSIHIFVIINIFDSFLSKYKLCYFQNKIDIYIYI